MKKLESQNSAKYPEYIGVEETADLLGISPATVYQKRSRRTLPLVGYKPTGKRLLFKKEDVMQLIANSQTITH